MEVRLDKYLAQHTGLTRSQAKKEIRLGHVQINEKIVKNGDGKVSSSDCIFWNQKEIKGEKYQYILLNKPAGIVSASQDKKERTVIEYIRGKEPLQPSDLYPAKDLFPMGRLDKDTEGLLILTNDGELAHRLLSPKHHVEKTYLVRLDKEITEEDVKCIQTGMDIGEKQQTRPAQIKILSPKECHLTITEGKFHQIKRMFAKLGKTVVYLKRIRMGNLWLPDSIPIGEWRFLNKQEMEQLILSENVKE